MDVADDGGYLTPDPPFAVHCALLSYRQGKDPVVVYSAHGEPGSAKTTIADAFPTECLRK